MITDKQGHRWFVNQTEHPFLTGWKCEQCGIKTFTYDDHQPADVPRSDKPCEKAQE